MGNYFSSMPLHKYSELLVPVPFQPVKLAVAEQPQFIPRLIPLPYTDRASPLRAVMGDFGMSLMKLANFEEAEGTRAGTYTDFGADARAIATESRRIGTVRTVHDHCVCLCSLDCRPSPS